MCSNVYFQLMYIWNGTEYSDTYFILIACISPKMLDRKSPICLMEHFSKSTIQLLIISYTEHNVHIGLYSMQYIQCIHASILIITSSTLYVYIISF